MYKTRLDRVGKVIHWKLCKKFTFNRANKWYMHIPESVKQLLYSHLPSIFKTIQIRRTRHAGYCWGSKDELISNVLLWSLSHGRASVGWSTRTYLQFWTDTEYSLEDLPEVMDDRDKWWKRVREIRASSMIWWWW